MNRIGKAAAALGCAVAALGLAISSSNASAGIIIKTNQGAGADGSINENVASANVPGPLGATYGGNGAGATIDARTNGGAASGNRDRNEIGVVRFDLSPAILGANRSEIVSAELELVYARNGPHTATFNIYGLNGSVAGEDTWAENTLNYGTFPGIDPLDNDSSTQGVANANTTLLGTLTITAQTKPASVGDINSATNSGLVVFSSPQLTAFLTAADSDDLVTILIARDAVTDNTQYRFATKESTALESSTPTGVAGDFAPRLDVVVPEPASLGLLALTMLPALRRRRA